MSRLVKEVAIDLDEDQADSAAAAETVVDEDGPVPADAETDADVVDEDIDPLDRLPPHAKKNQVLQREVLGKCFFLLLVT